MLKLTLEIVYKSCYHDMERSDNMIKYDRLLAKLKEQGITTYYLRKNRIVGESTLTSIRHNENINTGVLNTFCELLDCQPEDLIEYVPDGD